MPFPGDKPSRTFYRWLLTQRHRTDSVGCLIARRYAHESGRRWTYIGLLIHLHNSLEDRSHEIAALRRAAWEYWGERASW